MWIIGWNHFSPSTEETWEQVFWGKLRSFSSHKLEQSQKTLRNFPGEPWRNPHFFNIQKWGRKPQEPVTPANFTYCWMLRILGPHLRQSETTYLSSSNEVSTRPQPRNQPSQLPVLWLTEFGGTFPDRWLNQHPRVQAKLASWAQNLCSYTRPMLRILCLV